MIDENEIETDDQEIEVEGAPQQPEKAETAEETARAVWEELKAATPEDDEKAAEKEIDPSEAGRALAKSKKGKKRQTFVPEGSKEEAAATEPAQTEEKYEPPQHWELENKEWFNRQPATVQKEALKWFKNAQAQTTRALQELNRERQQAQAIREVAERHLPHIETHGLTTDQVIDQLFQFQQAINQDDVGAILEMMGHRNISLQDLNERLQSGQPTRRAATPQSQESYLTAKDVISILEQRDHQTAQQRATEAATEEVRSLMREVDATGKYKYPELHDPQYVQRLQYLISHVRATNPEASWKEVYRQAVNTDRQTKGVNTGTPSGAPRLTSQEIQNVRQASSSLRSRGGNGAIPRMADPKPNESARETAEAVFYEVFGNKQH